MPGLKVGFRGGVAYAIGSVAGGKRVRKSLGTRDEALAAELCAQYEATLWKRHSYGEEAVRTFEEAASDYMKADGERTYLPPLLHRFRGRVLGTIKPEEIRQAARSLYPGARASTLNRQAIVPARAVINFAAGMGWCSPIVVKQFPVVKVQRAAVDRAWLDAFLARADADGLPHLAAALLFMWQTGTRVSEATRILPEHVDLQRRQITLERTKTGEFEIRHITQEMVVRIANLPKVDGQPLFGYRRRFGLRQRMIAVCRRAGIPFVPPHQAGRHSFATNALAMGATPKEVMEAGGWKSARMVLEIYAHADGASRKIATMFDSTLEKDRPEDAPQPKPLRG